MLWLTDSRWLGFRMDGGWWVMTGGGGGGGVRWVWLSLTTAWKWCCDGAADLGDDDI